MNYTVGFTPLLVCKFPLICSMCFAAGKINCSFLRSFFSVCQCRVNNATNTSSWPPHFSLSHFSVLHVLQSLRLELIASVCSTFLICNEPVKDNLCKKWQWWINHLNQASRVKFSKVNFNWKLQKRQFPRKRNTFQVCEMTHLNCVCTVKEINNLKAHNQSNLCCTFVRPNSKGDKTLLCKKAERRGIEKLKPIPLAKNTTSYKLSKGLYALIKQIFTKV